MSKLNRMLADKQRHRHWPDWAIRLVDGQRRLGHFLRRPPLAAPAGTLSCAPLFIIGPGRSGTTLLRSMLVAGGEIAIPPETQVLHHVIRQALSNSLAWADQCRLVIARFESHALFKLWEINLYPAYLRAIEMPAAERSLARIIDEVYLCYAEQRFPGATMWGDQSPINTYHIRWLERTFPTARYVHLLRDGRDAIASLKGRGLSLEVATERWLTCVSESLAWGERLPASRFIEIRYEDMVREGEATLQRLCDFLDLGFKVEMLNYWQMPTTIEHRHQEYHRNLGKPLFTDSIGRWVERLEPEEQRYVGQRTNSLLVRLGYEV